MNKITKLRYMSNQYGNSVLTDNIFVNYSNSQKFFYIDGWDGAELYKRVSAGNVIPKMGLLDYKVVSNNSLYDGSSGDKTVSLGYPGMYDNYIMVRDLSFNGNTEKFKQFIIGNNVWFELETPTQGGYLPITKTRYITPTKNLFNINNGFIRQARCNGVIENGVATITATATNANFCFAKVDVEVGKTYIVSANWTTTGRALGLIVSNESSYDIASYGKITETTSSIKIVANGTELYLKGYVTYEKLPAVATISNIQVEENSVKTDYVPYGYLPYTKLKYKANDVCQLMNKSKYPATKTSNGITFTNNDGVITANGTATTTASYSITNVGVSVIGHKYLLAGGVNNLCYIDGYISYSVSDVHFGNDIGSGYIFTANVSGMMRVLLRVVTGYTATNVMFKPQLFDLTEMYGAGNEPATLAEFRQKYPNELYPYSPQCWY